MPFFQWEKVFLYCEPREYLRLRRVCKFFNAKIREQKWWKALDLRRYQGIEDVVRALESNEHRDDLENVLLREVQLGHSRESTLLLHRLCHSVAYCLKELRIELFPSRTLDESNLAEEGVTLMALRVLSVKFKADESPWNISPSVRAFIDGLKAPYCDTLEVEPHAYNAARRCADPSTARTQWIIVSKIVSGMKKLTTLKITITDWLRYTSEFRSVTTEMISSLLTNEECLLTELQNIHLYGGDPEFAYSCVLARLAVIITDGISELPRDVQAEVKSIIGRVKWTVVVTDRFRSIGEAEADVRLIRDSQVELQNALRNDVEAHGDESERRDEITFQTPLDANGSTVRWTKIILDVSPESLRSLYRMRHYVGKTLWLKFDCTRMGYGSTLEEVIVVPNADCLTLQNLNPFDAEQCDLVRRLEVGGPESGRELDVFCGKDLRMVLHEEGLDTENGDRWKDAVERLIASSSLRTASLRLRISGHH